MGGVAQRPLTGKMRESAEREREQREGKGSQFRQDESERRRRDKVSGSVAEVGVFGESARRSEGSVRAVASRPLLDEMGGRVGGERGRYATEKRVIEGRGRGAHPVDRLPFLSTYTNPQVEGPRHELPLNVSPRVALTPVNRPDANLLQLRQLLARPRSKAVFEDGTTGETGEESFESREVCTPFRKFRLIHAGRIGIL